MRLVWIFIVCCSLSASSFAAEKSSSVLLARAIQLLQDGKKQEALKTLERAFESSNDPNEIRVIGSLILEASPLDYPKRDAYLRYLVKFSPDHEDYELWMKELGDRSLNSGKLDEAEDWYLRALIHTPEQNKHQIEYQLAWVYWNKKQKEKAMDLFLKLYASKAELRENLRTDLVRLWWELPVLPPEQFKNFNALPKAEQNLLLIEWTAQTKQKKENQLQPALLQLLGVEDHRKALIDQINAGWKIPEHPCFFFQQLLKPEDSYPLDLLLGCMKVKKDGDGIPMLPYFEKWSGDRNESFDWAHAELLIQNNQNKEAAKLLLSSLGAGEKSADYIGFLEKLLLSLEKTQFEEVLESNSKSSFEIFLQLRPESEVLELLQSLQPEVWFPYEEHHLSESLDKEFWLKRTAWKIDQKASLDEIREGLEKAFSFSLNPGEKAVRDQLQFMQARAATQLPVEFGEEFRKEYDRWIRDLDRSIQAIQNAGDLWKKITFPFVQIEVQKNVEALQSQLSALQLPVEAAELQSEFASKKEELKRQLQEKYRPLLEAGRE